MLQLAILSCESVQHKSQGWDFLLVFRTHPEKHQVLNSTVWCKMVRNWTSENCMDTYQQHPTTTKLIFFMSFPWVCSFCTTVLRSSNHRPAQGPFQPEIVGASVWEMLPQDATAVTILHLSWDHSCFRWKVSNSRKNRQPFWQENIIGLPQQVGMMPEK